MSNQRKTMTIQSRMTPGDVRALNDLALGHQRSVSDLVRIVMQRYIHDEMSGAK